ncbi:hypothetical protein D0469_00830 [Peribacillus saganii]|uniref:Uncharacterized protein n=1 Tax=Peribacillus saganii TaxID=2303992 RepID=A0A372LVU6_9BACI|nr:hypothetical protein [Peribacillus saganii]RFU71684.1 hypothetical protein D0469_00830 [Peribacillus saganii]
MDTIIDFLLSNTFLLLIFAAFVSSLLKKKKKAVGNQNRKPSQQPGKSSEPLQKMEHIKPSLPPSVTTALNYPNKAAEIVSETKKENLQTDIANPFFSAEYKHREGEKSSLQGSTIKLDNKSIIDGIILAEVLGPPRAKRPASRRRMP